MNLPRIEIPDLRDINPRMPNLQDLQQRIPNVVQPRPNQRQRPTPRQRHRWRRNQGRIQKQDRGCLQRGRLEQDSEGHMVSGKQDDGGRDQKESQVRNTRRRNRSTL